VIQKQHSPYRFAGQLPPSKTTTCERPNSIVNIETLDSFEVRCKSTRSSRCQGCGDLHKMDIAAVFRSGFLLRDSGRGLLVTLTPPGADVLPWDPTQCTHSPDKPCSGKIGCRCEPLPLAIWHNDITERWSRWVEDVRRELNPGQTHLPIAERSVQVEYAKVYEPQKRDALHAHAMVAVVGPVSMKRVRQVMKRCAKRHGFGTQFKADQAIEDLGECVAGTDGGGPAARSAGYLAKYQTKDMEAIDGVVRLDQCTGEIRTGGIRSWSASSKWGDTKRQCIERRQRWIQTAAAGAGRASGSSGEALDLYCDFSATPTIGGPEWVADWAASLL
jgi:hypothetical protein